MLIALCSLKGSPGTTTSALALAARWPAPQIPVVVECDPAGGDLAARFRLPSTPGLVSLAAAARKISDASVLWQHVQRLPAGLAVVPGPIGAEQARAALGIVASGRASVLRAAGDQPGVVLLADCGRVEPGSPVLPIIRAADAMVLLAHARDDDLSHVAGKLRTVATWNPRPAFVLVGDGYTTAEVERELHIAVMARLPHDPKGAAVLCGYRRGGPGPDRSALGRAARRLVHGITTAQRPAAAPSARTRPAEPVPTSWNLANATPFSPARSASPNGKRP
ncbi:chromosome partitioning protein [Amycolatopsis sp. H20-H5]|uniref:chromosome partitioning protein n=1 Tax=Amycolatopsis sp. H20-H5 TaxID=3046309 RepID=UPI002DB88A95|nr:chromosome partitioning protein [Amycolatopsis sp. H20-H5]MEC3974316.1 chromosome partitioning protein [Amycolatopsis sp. H20-H5]